MSATVRSRTRSPRRLSCTRYQARPPGQCAIVWTRFVSDHCGLALEALDPVLGHDLGELPVELGERDELGLVDRRSRRASHGRRTPRASPAVSASARQREVEPVSLAPRVRRGWAARAREPAARGTLPSPERAGRPVRPRPGVRRLDMSEMDSRPPARPASRSSARVSKRLPIVRGLPVSCSRTGAPSDSSHCDGLVELLDDQSPAARGRRRGTRHGSSRASRWRQMTPLERSIEPPGRSPFSRTSGSAPSSRARAAATRPAMPAPRIARSAI